MCVCFSELAVILARLHVKYDCVSVCASTALKFASNVFTLLCTVILSVVVAMATVNHRTVPVNLGLSAGAVASKAGPTNFGAKSICCCHGAQ